MSNILTVDGLKTYFYTDAGIARAVDDVSFAISAGRTLALVGESGCGKSVTALSIMRLISQPPGRIVGGRIVFQDQNLLELSDSAMRRIRGNSISMIFQEPMTSLNPVFRIGDQIASTIRLHRGVSKKAARDGAVEMLHKVGIPAPEERINDYPHQMSGGMRQRVMIGMALACRPKILIADEPSTALDVTIQAQILDLLKSLRAETGMALLLITHDLGVVAETADDVAIMYAGKIVERAPVRALFAAPKHPYTLGLFNSIPKLGQTRKRLDTIAGQVPAAVNFPRGCRFHPRCPYAFEACRQAEPPEREHQEEQSVACLLYEKETMAREGRPVGIPRQEAVES